MTKQRKHYISIILTGLIWIAVIFIPHLSKGGIYSKSYDGMEDMLAIDSSIPFRYVPVDLDSVLPVTIPFVDSLCIVSDPTHSLQSFFAELNALLNGKDTVINIVHLGDSHIQAGYYTGRIMRRMHHQFGNAGRGWIAPFKLSKTNEPDDYFIKSAVKEWITGRCTQAQQKAPVGLGGIGIQTVSPSVNMDIIIGPVNGAGYEFNEAVIYRCEKSMPMLPAGSLKDSVETVLAKKASLPGIMADTFHISCLTDTLQLHSTRRKQGTDTLLPASSFTNTYYGFNLLNGGPGVLYHSVGVNGSMCIHYSDNAYLEQLKLLQPSLLIVSLGTNESFGRRFNEAEFTGQMRELVRLIRKQLPNTSLLLTTPAECYKRVTVNKKRTYVRNQNTEIAARSIVQLARKEGIACWDLFAATGGKDSSKKWYDKKLMGRDRIHFTKEGYWEQGELFYHALMKSYNEAIGSANTLSN